jgi:hypothetical protein
VLTKQLVFGTALAGRRGLRRAGEREDDRSGPSARKGALHVAHLRRCHTLTGTRATGPTFKGLVGSQVKLKSGKTVTADENYLYESIETSNKELVSTYSALMESTIKPHAVSQPDARDLIAFIKTVR